MKIEYEPSFLRDIEDLENRPLLLRIEKALKSVNAALNLSQISGVKKMKGYSSYCRIRVGDYRLGFRTEGETVIFVRCLDRARIYRIFP